MGGALSAGPAEDLRARVVDQVLGDEDDQHVLGGAAVREARVHLRAASAVIWWLAK